MAYCSLLLRVLGHGGFKEKRESEVNQKWRNGQVRSIVRKPAKEKDGEERRWQRADPAWSLVVTSRSASVQWRMMGAAALKGTGMVFIWEDRVGYSTAWCHRYRVGRVLLHSTTPVSTGRCGCVWLCIACTEKGQWGNGLLLASLEAGGVWNVWRRGAKRRVKRRTEQKPRLGAAGDAWVRAGGEGEMEARQTLYSSLNAFTWCSKKLIFRVSPTKTRLLKYTQIC